MNIFLHCCPYVPICHQTQGAHSNCPETKVAICQYLITYSLFIILWTTQQQRSRSKVERVHPQGKE